MYGIKLNAFNSAMKILLSLPANLEESVVDPNKKQMKQPKHGSNMSSRKYQSHVVKAFASLQGVAGYTVSQAMSRVHDNKIKKEALLRDALDDAAAELQTEIDEDYVMASRWMALRNDYNHLLKKQIAEEDLEYTLYPVTPFDVNVNEVIQELKEAGINSDKAFKKAIADEETRRNDIISLIEGIDANTDCGDAIRYDSLYKFLDKLEEFYDEEEEQRTKKANNIKQRRFAGIH